MTKPNAMLGPWDPRRPDDPPARAAMLEARDDAYWTEHRAATRAGNRPARPAAYYAGCVAYWNAMPTG